MMELKIKIPETLAKQINEEVGAIENIKVESVSARPAEGGSSFEPFTTMLLVITSYAIVSRVLDFIIDQKNPGAITYLDKNGDLSVEQNPGIPNGNVLFVSPDGQKEMFKREDIGKGLLEMAIAKFTPVT